MIILTTSDIGPGFSEGIMMIEDFVRNNDIYMGDFKYTCKNPNSGEKCHSNPIGGALFDLVNKTGLWVSTNEAGKNGAVIMMKPIEISLENLPTVFDDYSEKIEEERKRRETIRIGDLFSI